ncbi:MAG TPA: hypothetical protein VM848_01410 [Acidimicrobiia bacterium]|nr:hypothetical protein [Acidimicrobiia bacterium]
MRYKTGLIGLLVAVSTVVGGVAMAASNDTLLVEGFDPDNNALVFGVSEVDEDGFDCTVEGPDFSYVTDGAGSVISLTKNGQPASFKLVAVDVPYGQTGGVCDLTAVDVTGPSGQVNHGQLVSSIVHALKEQMKEAGIRGGVGCFARIVGQSDYGKGDEQQGPTVIDETVVVAGEVDLTAHETTCGGPKSDEAGDDADVADSDGNGNGNGNGNASSNGNANGNNGNANGPK